VFGSDRSDDQRVDDVGGLGGSELLGLVVSAGCLCFGWWRVLGYLPDGPNMRITDASLS
jgi:hypothetical protein